MTKTPDESLDDVLRMVWCPFCKRYLGESHRRGDLLAIAETHRVGTGHGVFLPKAVNR